MSAFSQIQADTSITLIIMQGETESLSIEGEDKIVPMYTNEVSGGCLVLTTRPNTSLSMNKPVIMRVTVTGLSALVLNGSVEAEMEALSAEDLRLEANNSASLALGSLTVTGRLDVSITGSGQIHLDSAASDSLSLTASGSGVVTIGRLTTTTAAVRLTDSSTATLAGTLDSQDVTATGSGQYTAAELASQTAIVVGENSAEIQVNVNDTLEATARGSASIVYSGGAEVTPTVSESGVVEASGS